MIDLVSPLKAIDALVPGPIELAVSELPSLSPAQELARTLGADPTAVTALHTLVTVGRERIGAIVEDAKPLLLAAGRDLFDIGADFLRSAIRIIPNMFLPIPGARAKALAELSVLTFGALAQAKQRIDHLAQELAPLVLQLSKVGTEPVAVLPPPVPEPAATPSAEPVFTPSSHETSSNAQGESAVQAALTQLGTPYVWGGTTPGVGFDCSGFTQWAWRQAGVELPRLAEEQTIGRPVSHNELQAGDLVVWDGHVAMYDGNGHIIEAGDPVSRNPLRQTNMGMAFKGYYRPTG